MSSLSEGAVSAEVKRLADRLNAAQIKVKRLGRLETAIIDFCMEVMERTATLPTSHSSQNGTSEHDSDFARNKRKEEFLKKAEGDPIALLNALRTHLRVQFTSYERQHHELQQSIVRLTMRGEMNARDANDEVPKWEAACEVSKEQMLAMAQQITATHEYHDRTARQYKRSLELLNTELHRLRSTCESQREILAKRQADVEELKHADEVLARDRKRVTDELARSGDHLKATAHGSPSNVGGSHVGGLFGSTPAEQQILKRVLQDYEFKSSKLESLNEELRNEVVRLQQHLASVKQSTQAQHCAKLEKDAKKQREILQDRTKKLADQEAELLRTRGTLKERDALIQDMKDEYNKLFSAMQKIKQTPTPVRSLARSASTANIGLSKQSTRKHKPTTQVESSSAELQAQANENPYLLQHYKTKIEQQQKELERAQTQIRKMIASEYRHKQKNKLYCVERVQLKDTCDNLRSELERAVKTTAKAMAQQLPFYITEDDGGRRDSQPGEDRPEDDLDDTEPASNQLCCTVADVRRLKQRNLYLEERFRAGAEQLTSGQPPSKEATASARPPRLSATTGITSLRRSSSTAEVPTLSLATERSIDSDMMKSLQQVKHSARARPQSAGPRAMLRSGSSVPTKSLM